jgi:hypothetical protein
MRMTDNNASDRYHARLDRMPRLQVLPRVSVLMPTAGPGPPVGAEDICFQTAMN